MIVFIAWLISFLTMEPWYSYAFSSEGEFCVKHVCDKVFFQVFFCCFTGAGERKNLTSHEDHHNLEKLIVKKWLIWFCFSGSGDGDHARWDNKLNKWLKKRTGLKNFYVQKMNFYTVWAWKLRVTIDRAFPIECLKTKPKYLLWKEEWKIPWRANENSE